MANADVDYTKYTVAQLRDVFKELGLATTGLTRKQQLLDRLADHQQDAPGDQANQAEQEHRVNDEAEVGVGEQDIVEEGVHEEPKADDAIEEGAADERAQQDEAQLDLPQTTENTNNNQAQSEAVMQSQGDANMTMQQADNAIRPSTRSLSPESRKRKRRSKSPPVKEEEIEMKRARIEDKDAARQYRDLVSSPTMPAAELDDKAVAPAIHPATNALYISGFMRPLKDTMLKAHLMALARVDTVSVFYLDQIKTHCFAVFESVTAASRVRSALHERVWPPEGTRKPLWVDFVPAEKVEAWIEEEKAAGNSSKRFEVIYPDGVAELVEAHARVPTGPRLVQEPLREPLRKPAGPRMPTTKAEPSLSYQPVHQVTVKDRLQALDQIKSRRPEAQIPRGGTSGLPDSMRYTFQVMTNKDRRQFVVYNGPEFGLRKGAFVGGRRRPTQPTWQRDRFYDRDRDRDRDRDKNHEKSWDRAERMY